MRQLIAALALASVCIFVASCNSGNQNAAPTTTSSTPPPIQADVLYGLVVKRRRDQYRAGYLPVEGRRSNH